jgi:hypothetical protein
MITLRIEHKISNYEGWKKAFDSDPVNRKKSGVKHYRIFRPADDEHFVIIDLEFETLAEAKATQHLLQNMWTKVEGSLIFGPKISMLNVIESIEV